MRVSIVGAIRSLVNTRGLLLEWLRVLHVALFVLFNLYGSKSMI